MADENDRVVKRIKAKTSGKPKKEAAKTPKTKQAKPATKAVKAKKASKKTEPTNYFVGAWHELRQVHWTNRRATWKLTVAVLLFSGFFALFILIADWIFNLLVQEVVL